MADRTMRPVGLIDELRVCFTRMTRSGGVAETTRPIACRIHVDGHKVALKIPAGAQVHFMKQSNGERSATYANVFIGDGRGSVVRVEETVGGSYHVEAVLRGTLLRDAKAGKTELEPEDFDEVRQRRSAQLRVEKVPSFH